MTPQRIFESQARIAGPKNLLSTSVFDKIIVSTVFRSYWTGEGESWGYETLIYDKAAPYEVLGVETGQRHLKIVQRILELGYYQAEGEE